MNVNKTLLNFIRISFTILVVLLFVYLGIRLCSTAYDFGYRVFTEPAIEEAPGQDVLIQIKEGMSAKEIGDIMEEKGLIRDSELFQIQLKLSAYSKKMLPGVYTLNTSMTPKEMIVSIAQEVEAKEKADSTESTEEAPVMPSTEEGEAEGTAPVEEGE